MCKSKIGSTLLWILDASYLLSYVTFFSSEQSFLWWCNVFWLHYLYMCTAGDRSQPNQLFLGYLSVTDHRDFLSVPAEKNLLTQTLLYPHFLKCLQSESFNIIISHKSFKIITCDFQWMIVEGNTHMLVNLINAWSNSKSNV